MEELREKAKNYAEENVVNVLKEAFAKVYADGYRDGYKDREDEIPVDLRTSQTKFIDLGLPSGTLWSASYEKDGEGYLYVPYNKVELFDIPTLEQWNELYTTCRWEYVAYPAGALNRIDCTGPNGHIVSFCTSGLINAKQLNKQNETYFWIKEEIEGNYKYAVHMSRQSNVIQNKKYFIDNTVVEKTFSGYKLPIRLVRTK